MLNWFIEYMKREEYIEDENRDITPEQRDWFVSFSNQIWEYAKTNYIPYDLDDTENYFCVQGAILKYEDIYLQFELWNGQGTVGLCYVVKNEDIKKVSNFITMDNLERNIQHENYMTYRLNYFTEKFKYLIKLRNITKQETEDIFKLILDTWHSK